MSKNLVSVSKYLSCILRHRPQSIGLELDANGWASIDELIACAAKKGQSLTTELINEVVATDAKQRYAISEDGRRIRANQGHSINVDLQLQATDPPEFLFHGTAEHSLEKILREGLKPMKRHHVHLSVDRSTAEAVGRRYGVVVVLRIDCQAMNQAGHAFFVTENNVWLTDSVPKEYLTVEDASP